MSFIKLSVCIPTYNRAAFIEETLDSIVSQADDSVEIVISDNASTDDTEEVVKRFQEKFSRITYFEWEENQGPDKNYLKVVELAQGEYCWFMGSDDAIVPGGVAHILKEIQTGEDIYIFNRIVCNLSMQPIRENTWLSPAEDDQIYQFKNRERLLNYLNSARSLGALFSYLSSVCVNRSKWNSIFFDKKYLGTAYSHVYILLSIVLSHGTLKYLKDSLVFCRGENDSFAAQGAVNRLLLDLDGYLYLSKLIEDPTTRKKFVNVLQKEHSLLRLMKLRSLSNRTQWAHVKYKLRLANFHEWKIFIAEIGRIKFLILGVLKIKHSSIVKGFIVKSFPVRQFVKKTLNGVKS